MKQVRAAIYARYSSERQNEQTIEWQIKECEEYARRKDFLVSKTYTDYAKSAYKNIEKRTAFMNMIADAKKNLFDILLVYKFDRFSRNRYESVVYKGELKKYNVTVISVTESIEGLDSETTPYEAMLEWAAQYYSKQTSERAMRGMRENAIKGLTTGGNIPLGYKTGKDKHLEIDEEKAIIVRTIFKLYDEGYTKTEIADILNQNGWRTKTGKLFNCNNLNWIIDNKMYYGDYTYKGEIPRSCPIIIDKDLWDRCNQRNNENKKLKGQKRSDVYFLLTGKVFCGHCGSTMCGESGIGRNDTKYCYYSCSKRKKSHECKKKNEKQGFLESYIIQETISFISDNENIEMVAENIFQLYKKDRKKDISENIITRLKEVEKDIDISVEALIKTSSKIAIEKINEKLEILEDKKKYLENELENQKIQESLILSKEDIISWIKRFTKGNLNDPSFQKRIINTFVNSVYVFDDKIVIYYNVKNSKQITHEEALKDIDEILSNRNIQRQPSQHNPKHLILIYHKSNFGIIKSRI